jgi:hypothetical protein
MYQLFFSENTDKFKSPLSPAFEKPRKNKLYPYIHENKFNHYNKNNIKMKKLKNSYEEQINVFIKNNPIKNIKNIKSKSTHTQTTSQTFKKSTLSNPYTGKDKYCPSYLNTKTMFISPKDTTSQNFEFQLSTSPMIFSSDNFNTENEIEKIKFVETEYSCGSLNTDVNKETNYFGELVHLVDDLNIDLPLNDYQTPNNQINTEININKLSKTSHFKQNKKVASFGQDTFLTKISSPSQCNLPLPKNLQRSHIKNKSQDFYETYSEDFYSLPIEKYSSQNKGRNPNSLKSKLISYYSSASVKENKDNPYNIAKEYTNFKDKSRNSKNFINQVSSFSKKLNSELGKISKSYGKPENHIKFSENPLTNKCFDSMTKFDAYKYLKISESRKTHNYRFKLAPLNGACKYEKLDKFGNKFFLDK